MAPHMQGWTVGEAEMPILGFGTWPMKGPTCREAVEIALECGYRHVDTAQMYENEREVGQAIANSSVDRADIFVVSKIRKGNCRPAAVRETVRESHDRLDVGTIDLMLIHSPNPRVPIPDTIGAMNELQDEGLVEHIGVSNFSVEQLRAAMDASETPIVTNQVAYHPFRDQSDLLEFCIDEDVVLTAYSPLAKGDVIGTESLERIGDRYGKTAAQVAIRWLIQQENVVAIPKASSRRHIEENTEVFDFELTDTEMAEIFELSGGLRERLRRLLRI